MLFHESKNNDKDLLQSLSKTKWKFIMLVLDILLFLFLHFKSQHSIQILETVAWSTFLMVNHNLSFSIVLIRILQIRKFLARYMVSKQ